MPATSRQRLIRWASLSDSGDPPTCACNQATSRFRFTNRILKLAYPSRGLPFFCQTGVYLKRIDFAAINSVLRRLKERRFRGVAVLFFPLPTFRCAFLTLAIQT